MLTPLVCSMPPVIAKDILVHGHRGARARRPENTIPAFEYAIRAGVDALEMDVAVTKDDVLVISHDPHINAQICTGPHPGVAIHELTLAELRDYDCGTLRNPHFPEQQPAPGTRIPTLDEVLALASQGDFLFNIETKSFPQHPELTPPPEEFARMLLASIRRHHLEKRVIVQSFDFRTLVAMKRLAPEILLSALWEGGPRSFTDLAKDAGGTPIVSPIFKIVTPERVAEAHAAGLQVVPWTVDTPADWQRMIDAQVDAIITDDPAALLAYLRERGLHK